MSIREKTSQNEARKSKLTTEQWEELADLRRAGVSLDNLAGVALERFSISISRQAIEKNRLIISATRDLVASRRQEARDEVLSIAKVVGKVSRTVNNILEDRDKVRAAWDALEDKSSREARNLTQQLRAMDMSIADLSKPLYNIAGLVHPEDFQPDDDAHEDKTDMIIQMLEELTKRNERKEREKQFEEIPEPN